MYFYIVNPAAGNGKINKIQSKLRSLLFQNKIDGEFVKTTGKGDAARVVKVALERGAKTIIAVGGDGTISEIINTVANAKAVLGVIPIGRTNILANILGINDWQQAVSIIAKRKTRILNLGQVNDSFFVASLDIGLTGEISKEGEEKSFIKSLMSKKRLMQKVISFKPFKADITFDKTFSVNSKIISISIKNTNTEKNSKEFLLKKPKLLSYILPDQSKLSFVKKISSLSLFSLEKIQYISQFSAENIHIDTLDKPQNVYADSALIGTTPIDVKASTRKIEIIASKAL